MMMINKKINKKGKTIVRYCVISRGYPLGLHIEDVAKKYYVEQGYKVYMICRGQFPPRNKHTEILFQRRWGIPDLVLFKNNRYSFIEVKNELDCVSFSQLDWHFRNKLSMKVLFVVRDMGILH